MKPTVLPRSLLRLGLMSCLMVGALEAAAACGSYRLALRPQPGVYERLPDGTEVGLDVELMRRLSQRSGCKFETVALSSALAWRALENGRMDLISSALATPERDRLAELVPVFSARMLLLLRRDLADRARDLPGLEADPQLRAIRVRGAAYPAPVQAWLDRAAARGQVLEVGDFSAAVQLFDARRGSALPVYPVALLGHDRTWLDSVSMLDAWPDSDAQSGLAMSLRTVPAADRQRLRESLSAMSQDGSLRRLLEQQLGAALARQVRTLP